MSLRPPISDLVCTSFVSQCLRNERYAILVLFPLRHDFSVARCRRLGEPGSDERNENKKERRNKKRETKKSNTHADRTQASNSTKAICGRNAA